MTFCTWSLKLVEELMKKQSSIYISFSVISIYSIFFCLMTSTTTFSPESHQIPLYSVMWSSCQVIFTRNSIQPLLHWTSMEYQCEDQCCGPHQVELDHISKMKSQFFYPSMGQTTFGFITHSKSPQTRWIYLETDLLLLSRRNSSRPRSPLYFIIMLYCLTVWTALGPLKLL